MINVYEETVLEHKGYKAQIMEAKRLTGEQTHTLPPGSALSVYPVDTFLKVPENWMKGPDVFVVPVRPNKGLWFSWQMNSPENTAIIPTVKGCNPITGMLTSGFHLEKYENKCPKHGCDFLVDRYCPECKYRWPDRNYVSMSPSWWDGFRSEDGSVRQFFFTEDELRDVATAMVGKENTVPAFGFAFYSPKERRQEYSQRVRGIGSLTTWGGVYSDVKYSNIKFSSSVNSEGPIYLDSFSISTGDPIAVGATPAVYCSNLSENSATYKSNKNSVRGCSVGEIMDSMELPRDYSYSDIQAKKEIKEVSVGAGAKINQSLPTDTYAVDTWKDTPDAVMTIYFVFNDKFQELKAGGMRDFKEIENGMLNGVVVG